MSPRERIFVAGLGTMTGQALVRRFTVQRAQGQEDAPALVGLGADEPDLRDPAAVDRFFADTRPDAVFVVAGEQAGIAGNQQYPADLMIDNLRVATSIIPAASRHGTTKLLYLASSCTYPKLASQPFRVESLWTGPVEPTSAAYAVAKLAGMKLVEAYRQQTGARFINGISADSYGPGDDFSPDRSHVVGALMRRMHDARQSSTPVIEIWGTGTPRREFIYVDDLADACIFAMAHDDGAAGSLNLGTAVTTSIAELAEMIREVVGYHGELTFDTTKPDGMPLKGLDSSRLRSMGWTPAWNLRDGVAQTYRWFLDHVAVTRTRSPSPT